MRLQTMLEEIRDSLKSLDPLLEEIDKRNMMYARSSTERVKAMLEPDSTIAGKLMTLTREIINSENKTYEAFPHHLHRIKTYAHESLYRRYKHENPLFIQNKKAVNKEDLEKAENEFLERMRKQLNVKKILHWLDENGGTAKLLSANDLIHDESSFIHFVYSVLYADARPSFDYNIEENAQCEKVIVAGFNVPDLLLRRKD
jgi:hypothetical protein